MIPRLTKNNYSLKKKWSKTATEGKPKSTKGVYIIWERMDYSLLFFYIFSEYPYTKAETKNEVKQGVPASSPLATQKFFIYGAKRSAFWCSFHMGLNPALKFIICL